MLCPFISQTQGTKQSQSYYYISSVLTCKYFHALPSLKLGCLKLAKHWAEDNAIACTHTWTLQDWCQRLEIRQREALFRSAASPVLMTTERQNCAEKTQTSLNALTSDSAEMDKYCQEIKKYLNVYSLIFPFYVYTRKTQDKNLPKQPPKISFNVQKQFTGQESDVLWYN